MASLFRVDDGIDSVLLVQRTFDKKKTVFGVSGFHAKLRAIQIGSESESVGDAVGRKANLWVMLSLTKGATGGSY